MHGKRLLLWLGPLFTLGVACGDVSDDATSDSDLTAGKAGPTGFATLDGKPPMVVAHRGFPGRRPEQTGPSYELAADVGADALEEDVHLSKDCVLVARHNPWLSDNTNVVDVAKENPAVAARKRTVRGRSVPVRWETTPTSGPSSYLVDQTDPEDPKSVLKSLVVDGEDHTNDWSITDFTVEELQQWLGGTTYDAADERVEASSYNGQFPILTFQQIIDMARAKSKETGRTIFVYPETKNPTWNNAQAIANGCGAPGSRPLEDALLTLLEKNDLNSKDAPIIVQSFEPGSLKYLREKGLEAKAVQLIDASGVDYRTGDVLYNDIPTGRPYDWTVAGDPRWYDVMLTRRGLEEIKTYADGIGPWKPQIVPLKITPFPDAGPDGGPYVGSTREATTQTPTTLIADAHAAGLIVHAFTFRNEKKYLAADYGRDPKAEYLKFFRLGLDGVFTDFASEGVAARAEFLKELKR